MRRKLEVAAASAGLVVRDGETSGVLRARMEEHYLLRFGRRSEIVWHVGGGGGPRCSSLSASNPLTAVGADLEELAALFGVQRRPPALAVGVAVSLEQLGAPAQLVR